MEAVLPVALTLVLTFISPFITAYFNKVNWSPETKNLVSLLVSAVIAVVYLLLTGGIADWSQLGVVIPAVYGLSQLVYQFLLKVPATKLEAATDKGSVVITPTDPGKAVITTDESIKQDATPEEVSEPIITTTTEAKG